MLALVRWSETAVSDAISLCQGLATLRPGDRVLIKPNLPLGGETLTFTPGMYTSAAVVEQIVRLLRDRAVGDISIAEGSAVVPSLHSSTRTAFAAAGYTDLQRRYGANLIDVNEGPFVERACAAMRFSVAAAAFEHDFLINVPCLKTHAQTKISLAMKNSKGLLDDESRKRFHRHGLDEHIAALSQVVHTDLVVIDGRLALEYGPISNLARPSHLIVASPDVFDADVVGSQLLGIAPEQVDVLRHWERLSGRSIGAGCDVRGESVGQLAMPCRWHEDEWRDLYAGYGLRGIRIGADRSGMLCSMCLFAVLGALSEYGSAHEGEDLGGVELMLGGNSRRLCDASTMVLFGDCPIAVNGDLTVAVAIEGCPPAVDAAVRVLEGLSSRTESR